MEEPLRLLHLEDNPADAELIRSMLESEGMPLDITCVQTRKDFENALRDDGFDLILSDFSVPSFDGLSALAIARELRPNIPFLFVSGTIGEETAVESLKQGATDFVIKNRLFRLVPAVRRALRDAESRRERRGIEERLRERDELFRQITENVDDLIAVLDLNGIRLFNSPSYGKLFGDIDALAGTNSFANIHPADRERVEKIFRQTVATGIGQRTQFRFLLQDGAVRFIESQGSVIRDKQGQITKVVVVSRDVTERYRAEEQIREQAALLDKAQDAICVHDMEQRILYWNKSAQLLYGWASHEVIGKDAVGLLFRGNLNSPLEATKALIARGEWQGELKQKTRDGRKIVVQSRWTLMRDQHDRPKSILMINTDITERKVIEQQFLRTQRMETIGALAGGIAHDLNNLLGPIMMATELLQDETPDPEGRKMLQLVRNNAQRGCEMVKQILSFARGVSSDHQPLEARSLIEEMIHLTKNTFPRAIQIEAEVPPGLPLIIGDTTQLHQVLLNLCVNARDAMPEGGNLGIKASQVVLRNRTISSLDHPISGRFVVISVRDTGVGIPPELVKKIFEPFFTTKEMGKGSGLGLSTVAGIVKNHHGFMDVSSEVGKGSTFSLYLPALLVAKPFAVAPEQLPQVMGAGELILLVDDEVAVLEITKETLETFNYRVLTAKDGPEAIRVFQARREEIKAVVIDMMTPPMDGPAAIRAMRQSDPKVKIICASATGQEATCAEFETQAFLKKPFTADELLSLLRTVIGPAGTELVASQTANAGGPVSPAGPLPLNRPAVESKQSSSRRPTVGV